MSEYIEYDARKGIPTIQPLNTCPNAPDGKHRYFIYRVITEYEQIPNEYMLGTNEPIYQKVEYALSGCNCGHPLKRKVEAGEDI